MKNDIRARACIIANHLVKQGVSRSAAMFRAWLTVKLHRIETKTAGVTKERRQALLDRLRRYALQAESTNEQSKAEETEARA